MFYPVFDCSNQYYYNIYSQCPADVGNNFLSPGCLQQTGFCQIEIHNRPGWDTKNGSAKSAWFCTGSTSERGKKADRSAAAGSIINYNFKFILCYNNL